MTVQSVRPDVRELMFRLYGRSVHPELLPVHASTTLCQNGFTLAIHICDSGHLLSLRYKDETVTEVAASRDDLLPRQRRLFEKEIRGSRNETRQLDNGVRYYASYQIEHLDPEVFLNVHSELERDSITAAVAHAFPAAGRFDPAPLSLVITDIGSGSLLVHAFHTFPENCAVVKTQSLFEL